jgi:hypothetical protein
MTAEGYSVFLSERLNAEPLIRPEMILREEMPWVSVGYDRKTWSRGLQNLARRFNSAPRLHQETC